MKYFVGQKEESDVMEYIKNENKGKMEYLPQI